MKNKNIAIFSLFAICLFFNSCTIHINKSNLEADIEGLGNDTLLVECYPIITDDKNIEPHQSFIVAKDNKFTYRSPYSTPSLVYISPSKVTISKRDGRRIAPIYIFALIEPQERIYINGELKKYFFDYQITGSKFNKDYSEVRSKYDEKLAKSVQIEIKIDSIIGANIDRFKNKSPKINSIKKLIKEKSEERENIISFIEKTKTDYIKNNPDNNLSALFLTELDLDTIGTYYPMLSERVKNGMFKMMLDSHIKLHERYQKIKAASELIVKGALAPNFTLKSITDEDRRLSDFDNEIIVLEFWGSWCSWCIKGYPKMKQYYNKYKTRLELIGIACNDYKDDWKDAVKTNELNWVQLFNEDNDTENNLIILYGIQYFPTKIIIDKNKQIIGKYIGEDPSFYKKLDELLGK